MPPLLCGCNLSGCEAGQWTVSFDLLFFALIWNTTRPRALVPPVEFMYLVFTCMLGEAESYRRRGISGLCCGVLRVTSFECWVTFLFQCVKELLLKCTVLKTHLLYMGRESVVRALLSPRRFTGWGSEGVKWERWRLSSTSLPSRKHTPCDKSAGRSHPPAYLSSVVLLFLWPCHG